MTAFRKHGIVEPSGRGRTKKWRDQEGTVTETGRGVSSSVLVHWDRTSFTDEMDVHEIIPTGRRADKLSQPSITCRSC